MKKIVITETQLKRLTKSLVTEQSQINLGGLPVLLNKSGQTPEEMEKKIVPKNNPNFGTLTFNIGGKTVRIRLFTSKYGDVNIVELQPKKDGAYIKTLKGREQNLDSDIVSKIIEFVKNPSLNDVKLDSSFLVGDLKAKKI
jgi:hypothetical protein